MKNQGYQICSIVAMCKLADKLDRAQIANAVGGQFYPELNIPFVLYRPSYSAAKVMLYPNGAIIVAGERAFRALVETETRLVEEICALGYSGVLSKPWRILNIVVKLDVGKPLPIKDLAVANLERAEYEPESFPGLLVRPGIGKTVLLIFASGHVVITGTKSEHDIKRAIEATEDFLRTA